MVVFEDVVEDTLVVVASIIIWTHYRISWRSNILWITIAIWSSSILSGATWSFLGMQRFFGVFDYFGTHGCILLHLFLSRMARIYLRNRLTFVFFWSGVGSVSQSHCRRLLSALLPPHWVASAVIFGRIESIGGHQTVISRIPSILRACYRFINFLKRCGKASGFMWLVLAVASKFSKGVYGFWKLCCRYRHTRSNSLISSCYSDSIVVCNSDWALVWSMMHLKGFRNIWIWHVKI